MNEIESRYWNALEQLLRSKDFDNIFQNDDWTTSARFLDKVEDKSKEIIYAKLSMSYNDDENANACLEMSILQQSEIGRYRADFEICVFGGRTPPVSFAIEIDGHEWHEKNKQQVARDKIRERSIVSSGYIILRYSGSEVFNTADECAWDTCNTIIDHITNVWPREHLVKSVGVK